MDLGLERITRLLESLTPTLTSSASTSSTSQPLKPPHLAIPILHVAGTNGKGSICAYLASSLQASGLRVGRYNSPHLITPRDTIQVNGQPISQSDYEYVTALVAAKDADLGLKATSFELLTAAAFYWFAYGRSAERFTEQGQDHEGHRAGVDVAVIEVGVGGRLDATNIVPRPEICVIASIGMDHAGLLGNTIQEVAFEKAGIIKPNVPVVIAPQSEGEKVYKVMDDKARSVGLTPDQVHKVTAAHWFPGATSHVNSEGVQAELEDGFQFWVPLLGDFQLENVATAIKALQVLSRTESSIGYGKITNETIRQGIRATVWPGRLQWLQAASAPRQVHGDMLIDGAHNPAAAIALKAYVDQHLASTTSLSTSKPRTVHWIMAFTKGKDIEEMFEILFPSSSSSLSAATSSQVDTTFSALEFSPPEGMPWVSPIPTSEVCSRLEAHQLQQQGGKTIRSIKGYGTDLVAALTEIGAQRQEQDVVILCGSLYLVADLMRF
ncbi:folylpolyglutamate synthase [Gryganskiella cystojenkinii]|nr:folylpolyglutamate synthase [Gryganskiella cystojenkinii]